MLISAATSGRLGGKVSQANIINDEQRAGGPSLLDLFTYLLDQWPRCVSVLPPSPLRHPSTHKYQVSEEQLIQMLEQVSNQVGKAATKVSIQRRKYFDDDEEDNDDDLL